MNEKGLTVEILWNNAVEFPFIRNPKSKTLNESQWIQYMLDNASSVQDVEKLSEDIQITRILADVHYFVCDKAEDCIIVQFLNGELDIVTSKEMPVQFLSNSTYQDLFINNQSKDSFIQKYQSRLLGKYEGESIIDQGFSLLDDFESVGWSRWQIVYDISDQTAYFRSTELKKTKSLSFKDFDSLDCRKGLGSKYIEINADTSGESYSKLKSFGSMEQQRFLAMLTVDGESLADALIMLATLYLDSGLQCTN